ncbi:MAG: hypothetical protein PHW76_07900 [Alphaproteobacteria bacterium]|nr:hypothetical protein [Alphaproteobacteria bacterium]
MQHKTALPPELEPLTRFVERSSYRGLNDGLSLKTAEFLNNGMTEFLAAENEKGEGKSEGVQSLVEAFDNTKE